jgi:hypothetical protein
MAIFIGRDCKMQVARCEEAAVEGKGRKSVCVCVCVCNGFSLLPSFWTSHFESFGPKFLTLRPHSSESHKRHDEQIAAVMSQLNTLGSAISSVMARLDALLPSATASGPPTQGRVADLVAAFGGAAIAPTGVAAALRQ